MASGTLYRRTQGALIASLCLAFLASTCWAEPASPDKREAKKPEVKRVTGNVLQAFFGARETRPPAKAEPSIDETDPKYQPTHEQTAILKVTQEGESKVSVFSFCLSQDGDLLVGCGQGPGEVRVMSPDGALLNKWSLEVKPDAMNIGPDGSIYVAGGGKLIKLSPQGEVLMSKDAPHVANLKNNREALREDIKAQAERTAKSYGQMVERYQKMIEQLEKTEEADRTEQQKQQLSAYKRAKEQMENILKTRGAVKMTDEQLEQRVDAAITQKSLVSSISVTEDAVFVTCRMAKGYGFEVWRLNGEFEDGKQVVDNLRGCCGQMDVHARGGDLFVAENARHRVARYDTDGKLLNTWGKGDREGVEGFCSCCNPMNVCFGPDDIVYTAEDTKGRIKKYKPDGTLVSVVGNVKVVPGCKDVSIAATPDGKRVYMVDITRSHIIVMSEKEQTQEKTAAAETSAVK